MTLWITVQILIDFLLLTAIVVCYFRIKKVSLLKRQVDNRIEDLLEVKGALGSLLHDSVEVSGDISKQIDKERSLMEEVLNAFDKEKKTLSQLTKELKSEAILLREELGKYDIFTGKVNKDKYSEAIRLAETGLNAEEIAKKTNIPLGEIELALSLRK